MRKMVWIVVGSAIFFSLISCAGQMAFKTGEEAFRTRDWDRSVEQYLKAIQSDPNNPRYRLALAKALIEASNYHTERGEKFLSQNELKLALIEFQRALDYNPEDLRAKKRKMEIMNRMDEEKKKTTEKTEIEKIKERAARRPQKRVMLGPGSETLLDLKFVESTDLLDIFKTLQLASGINFLFDESFKSKKISVYILNVTFKEALDRLLLITGLFYKILDEQTILIIPDTPQKRREYEELILKTFYLSNADVNQIQGLLRTLADIRVVGVNPELKTISVKDTQQKIEIAERIIASQDKAKAELVIDVEILEVNKSRMREYGIELSNYQITESLVSGSSATETSASLIRGHMFYTLDSSDFLFSIPSISYKLLESDTKSKIIAKPQLRVIDGETISVKLGDKVPVPVTTFVPIAAGGINQQAVTSFQMYDVGINIDFTPRVHHNGDITLKLKFELSFITTPGTAIMPPTIGNRAVTTVIRMKDNETGLLAGLLRDSERKSQRGFPGLNSIPILNKIFSGNSEEISQTDIILTLTPRITRMPDISEEDLASIWVGTEKEVGIKEPSAISPFKVQSEQAGEKEAGGEIKKEEVKEATISIVPFLSEVPPKVEFMVKAMAENLKNVASATLFLNYDPAVLQVKDVREGDFLSQNGVKTAFLKNIDNKIGEINISVSREGFKEGASGSGEIAVIIFESLKEDKTNIRISGASLRSPQAAEIPVVFREAQVVVK